MEKRFKRIYWRKKISGTKNKHEFPIKWGVFISADSLKTPANNSSNTAAARKNRKQILIYDGFDSPSSACFDCRHIHWQSFICFRLVCLNWIYLLFSSSAQHEKNCQHDFQAIRHNLHFTFGFFIVSIASIFGFDSLLYLNLERQREMIKIHWHKIASDCNHRLFTLMANIVCRVLFGCKISWKKSNRNGFEKKNSRNQKFVCMRKYVRSHVV